MQIVGLNQESNIYIPEEAFISDCYDGELFNKYKYSDTGSVIITKQLSKQGDKKIKAEYYQHNSQQENMTVNIPSDGAYITYYIILPTVQWLQAQLEKGTDILNLYSLVYVIDNSHIYKYIDSELTEIPLDEILEINPDKTTISISSKISFSICRLNDCYISLCKHILNNQLSKCENQNLSELTFKRDYIWMTVNVIKYLVEQEQYMEAQNILDQINRCNQFCYNNYVSNNTYECGCN